MARTFIGPLPLHPTLRLAGLTRAHTAALREVAEAGGEFVAQTGDRWAITTPEHSYIGGAATTCNWVFGEAAESPLQWLDRHADRYAPTGTTELLLAAVRRKLLAALAAERYADWEYAREKADYDG